MAHLQDLLGINQGATAFQQGAQQAGIQSGAVPLFQQGGTFGGIDPIGPITGINTDPTQQIQIQQGGIGLNIPLQGQFLPGATAAVNDPFAQGALQDQSLELTGLSQPSFIPPQPAQNIRPLENRGFRQQRPPDAPPSPQQRRVDLRRSVIRDKTNQRPSGTPRVSEGTEERRSRTVNLNLRRALSRG